MATRLYFPSSGVAPVSPLISAVDWSAHVNAQRLPLNAVNGGSAINTLTYTPDAADHLVAGRAHVAQFVSDLLPPQDIPDQQVKIQVRIAEVHAGNNLALAWKIYAVSEDGQTVLGTLLPIRVDATEAGTALTNRGDSATTTQVTIAENFRLVIELGLSGTPAAASGIQGHNGSFSFGENAAADLPEDDATTGALNPWIQFAQNMKFWNPPVPPPGWIRAEVALAKGDPANPAGWAVSGVLLSALLPFESRRRLGNLFLAIANIIDWDHDDIIVLMTDANLSASLIDRIKEVRNHTLPMQKACLLESGLRLDNLTPAQIAARVG